MKPTLPVVFVQLIVRPARRAAGSAKATAAFVCDREFPWAALGRLRSVKLDYSTEPQFATVPRPR
jgi:hypothetical protein